MEFYKNWKEISQRGQIEFDQFHRREPTSEKAAPESQVRHIASGNVIH